MTTNILICVVGPTAVGKTKSAIKIAQWLGCEIVSADSRQFYQEMNIGTAKPDAEELAAVKHHFINNLSITQAYDVGQYEKDVLRTLEELFEKHQFSVLVGGSGMFVDAVVNGLDQFPEVPKSIRETLNTELQEKGIEALQLELKTKDPEYFEEVDRQNPQRVVRALEVIRASGQSFSSFRTGNKANRPFKVIKIGLETDRAKLYERIDLRMDLMIEAGLFEEAKALLPYQAHNALQTVGYKEIFGYLAGAYDKEEAIRLLKRNSRRYAKRQLTWFKRDESTQWFEPSDVEGINGHLELSIAKY